MEGELGGENGYRKTIPEGMEGMESVAQKKMVGDCYFQREVEAWI